MNAEVKTKFKNKYHIELIDAASGEIKQQGDFHNIVLKNMSSFFVGATWGQGELRCDREGQTAGRVICRNAIYYRLGLGSGITPPTETDTGLSKSLWEIAASSHTYEWIDDYSMRFNMTYQVPATTSYIGTVSEIGLKCRYCQYGYGYGAGEGPYITHALLTDSEGAVIQFNKTELDLLKITVIVEISWGNITDNFHLFKKAGIFNYMTYEPANDTMKTTSFVQGIVGPFTLGCYKYDCVTGNNGSGNYAYDASITSNDNYAYGYYCNNETNGTYFRIKTNRMQMGTYASETYFRTLAFKNVGYFTLPDENILPAYDITNIDVGVGDGVTTQFTNPLCYFKKNTETVYVNGVPMVRGVDYIINHVGNKSNLAYLYDMNEPIKVHSDVEYDTTLTHGPLIVVSRYAAYRNNEPFSIAFSYDHPLYIEYPEEVEFNCCKCNGGLRYFIQGTATAGALPVGTTFYVDYSLDGTTYEELGSAATTANNNVNATGFTIDFDSVSAKYWRIRTDYQDNPVAMIANNHLVLIKNDPYITFTTPPAEGDIIKMDVKMDILMKNSNFVVDLDARVDFAM